MKNIINLSIVIPVYKSKLSLEKLYNELTTQLLKIGRNYEIIFVEDGGNDGSWEIINELLLKDTHIIGIKLKKNFGQHNALLAGIRAAHGELILTIDDDLQHPPHEISRMIAHIENGFDVVYGAPKVEQHGFFRDIASILTKKMLYKAIGSKTAKNMSAFRIFRSNIRDAFKYYSNPAVNIDVLLTWGGSSFSSIIVDHNPRKYGKSNYTLYKLITHALNMTSGFSVLPLRISGVIGLIFTIFGFFVFIYVLYMRVFYGTVAPGFTFLTSIISIFAGVQLISLGIIGQYISQIFLRSSGIPAYIIEVENKKYEEIS